MKFNLQELKVYERERVYRGWLQVDRLKISHREPDGGWSPPYLREVVECGFAVAILLQNVQSKELLFVRQLRVPLERHDDVFPLEIVAGKVEDGETAEAAAMREVAEEVDLHLEEITPICSVYPSPGVLSEVVHIFFGEYSAASGSVHGQASGSEVVTPVTLTVAEAWAQFQSGEIRDAKTVVALQWLAARNR